MRIPWRGTSYINLGRKVKISCDLGTEVRKDGVESASTNSQTAGTIYQTQLRQSILPIQRAGHPEQDVITHRVQINDELGDKQAVI